MCWGDNLQTKGCIVLKLTLPAAIVAVLAMPAVAAPTMVPKGLTAAAPSAIQTVAWQGSPRRDQPKWAPQRRWTPPAARMQPYRSGPRGWHRYYSRPWNWRYRGCTQIGPLWFCP